MGAQPPHMTLARKARNSNKNQPPTPQRPCPPMCNTTNNHTHQTRPPRPTPRSVVFRLAIGPIQPGQPDVETRTTSSRAKATCHAPRNRQRTADPRNRTDLDAEMDRSRREFRPISTRKRTELDTEYDRSRRHPLMRAARPATDCPRTTSSAASAPPAVIGSIDPRADAEPLRRADAGRPRRRSAVPPRRRGR